jgi:hypothetical protein
MSYDKGDVLRIFVYLYFLYHIRPRKDGDGWIRSNLFLTFYSKQTEMIKSSLLIVSILFLCLISCTENNLDNVYSTSSDPSIPVN